MYEPPPELRRQLNELAREMCRGLEAAGRMARQAARDAGWSDPPAAPSAASATSAVEAIRSLGELRDAGLVTEEEFQAKKAELLRRI